MENLPKDWEPYAVQPKVGMLFWFACLLLVFCTVTVVLLRLPDPCPTSRVSADCAHVSGRYYWCEEKCR
jgi:hypothetical protein